MALETANYISDLVSTNPESTDGLAQADDHLRLIKSVLQSTFPNINAALSGSDEDLNTLTSRLTEITDVLDGVNPSTHIPSGVVLMWSGSDVDVPNGWSLCDGTNGTPDLRDRFVLGSSDNSTDLGASGSTHTLTSSQSGSHNHTTTTGSTTQSSVEVQAGTGQVVDANLPHTHPITSDGTHLHTVSMDSGKVYRIAYIIKD